MMFKLFVFGSNTENEILKAGFRVNSYEEHNVYNGEILEFTSKLPKDYVLNGDIWKKIDASSINERACCLAKTPFLTFQEAWNLAFQANQEDERIGALLFMYKYHYQKLREAYKIFTENNDGISKAQRKILKILSRMLF